MDPSDLSKEELDPGIRRLVVWLNSLGFKTTDSGDGVTKPEEHRSLEGPHVFMTTTPDKMVEEANRLHALILNAIVIGLPAGHPRPEFSVEASYSADTPWLAVLMLLGVNDEMIFG